MRNREIGVYVLVTCVLSAAGVAAGFLLGQAAGLVCLVLAVALGCWGLAFTLWRYRKIRRLSDALASAAARGVVLDVRTSREGELSILQNDLYKITTALADHAERMQQDKVFLADALSDISHQIKTPLTSLLVHSDLLQDESLPPEKRQEFLARISAQLERIRWLVSSLLKLSRVDAAVVEFRREDVSLHSLLSKAAEPLLPLAEQKNVALLLECPRALRWTCDPDWTQEAFGNLIKNCLEHAPEGGEVAVRASRTALNTVVFMEDDGPGFAPEDLPRLFERFYRGSSEGEGVGIGLAMAKSVLHRQQADLRAENRPGGGARFVARL